MTLPKITDSDTPIITTALIALTLATVAIFGAGYAISEVWKLQSERDTDMSIIADVSEEMAALEHRMTLSDRAIEQRLADRLQAIHTTVQTSVDDITKDLRKRLADISAQADKHIEIGNKMLLEVQQQRGSR